MFKNRLFNILVAVILVVMLALSVQNAFATAGIVSKSEAAPGTKNSACASLPSIQSVHAQYLKEIGRWVTYTDSGPTGVDGGLIYLGSMSRICSR